MMTHRWGAVTRDRYQKAQRSEQYVNKKKIHINIAFTRSRKSKDVEILGAEI